MKKASQNAIESAQAILAQSLLAENAMDVESLISIDVKHLCWAIDATLASVKQIILAPIQEKLEERNLRLPVNQLPVEIFEIIFREYLRLTRGLNAWEFRHVYKYGTGVDHQAVIFLALVSKRWHHIVLGIPSLWTVVSMAMPRGQVDKWLTLSGSHPLDVHCWIDSGETDSENFQNDKDAKASLLKFVEAITPHLARYRLIDVDITGGRIQDVLPMFSTPNQTIESLEMHQRHREGDSDSDIVDSLTLFQNQAPKLAHIEITGIQIDWRSLAYFPALQTLILCGLTIPTSQIESGLNGCLALRVLELDTVFLDDDVPAPGAYLNLQDLQRLVCKFVREYRLKIPFTSRIRKLSSLESVHLDVDVSYGSDPETYFQANIAHLLPDFSRILGSAACIRIDWDGYYTGISNTEGSFSLEFTTESSNFLYRHFCDILFENGFSGDVDFFASKHAIYYIRQDTCEWPDLNVSRLTLKEGRYDRHPSAPISQILMYLGDFIKDPQHWSTLRSIRLDFPELHLDWLSACLKKRYSGTSGSSVKPQHLNIHIKCWENGTSGLEELKATHGVDSVILEEDDGSHLVSKPWEDEAQY